MTDIVQFAQNEQLTLDDLNYIGVASRNTFDTLTADAVDSSLKFASFPIAQVSTTSINVGAGRLYSAGQQFSNEDAGGFAIPLINYLPATAGNTKIISIVAFGQQADSNSVPRTFLTNAATGVTEADNVSTTNNRRANLAAVPGAEAPTPNPPPLSANQCEVARIVLSTTGIVSMSYIEANRLQTNTSLDERATSLELWRVTTGARIDTLASDISNVAKAIKTIPSAAIFSQIVNSVAELLAYTKVPTGSVNYHVDNLLTLAASSSDPTNSAYLAVVQEGIRFPPAIDSYSPLTLFNPIDPKIQPGSSTGIMLPAYDEVARIDTIGNDGSISLSQYQYQTVTGVQKNISRQVLTFGTSETVCSNSLFWQTGTYDPITGIFSRNGENYIAYDPSKQANGQFVDHTYVRLTQFFISTMTDTYTDYNTTNFSVSGSIVSQTFLNSQPGWLTSIDIGFTSIGSTGDVTMVLCGVINGVPDFTTVIGKVTVPVASLAKTTRFPLGPTFLDAGSRYAIVLHTAGNHSVAYVANNKYAQGSLFISTDGAFSQGNLLQDLSFRANFAKFSVAVCQVLMTPAQLLNGITDINLVYGSKIPTGTSLIWEIQVGGLWYPMKSYISGSNNTNPLLGLPAIVPLRLTYEGTTDLMPGIDMNQTQVHVSRPRGDFTHVTPQIVIGASSSTINVEVVCDYFDPAFHTNGCNLIINNANVAPVTTTTSIDPNRSQRRRFLYTFNLGSPTTSFAIKINGTTTAVTNVYHVESRYDYES